jgi:uncharacterized Zn finger protein
VAATHYVLGEALDRDPFLLFELRGRSKEQVLAALRSARGGQTDVDPAAQPTAASVVLGPLNAEDYDKLEQPLPTLQFSFEASAGHSAVLRQLGAPPTWTDESQPADVLAPLVRAAAESARRLALNEPSQSEEPAGAEQAETEVKAKAPAKRPRRASPAKSK